MPLVRKWQAIVWDRDWHPITNTAANQLTGCTLTPGKVYEFPIADIPAQLQRIPGLRSCYVSGYAGTIFEASINRIGEIAVVREDRGVKKAYQYLLGVANGVVYFTGPFKDFPDHYFDAVPVENLFVAGPDREE